MIPSLARCNARMKKFPLTSLSNRTTLYQTIYPRRHGRCRGGGAHVATRLVAPCCLGDDILLLIGVFTVDESIACESHAIGLKYQ